MNIVKAEKWTRIPEIPIHEAVFYGIGDHLHQVALVDAEDPRISYTYDELYKKIIAVTSGLYKLGLRKGDVLAFFAPNSTQFVIGAMACYSGGITLTGVNFNYTSYELGHQLQNSQATHILTTSQNLPVVRQALAEKHHELKIKTIISLDARQPGCVYFGDLLGDDGSAYPRGLKFNVHEDVAALMYSSGTTGLPKGVMLTHYNLVSNLTQLTDPSIIAPTLPGEQLAMLAFLPMFHMFGMIMIIGMLKVGAKSVTIQAFKPEIFLKTIQDQKITNLYVVPPVVVFLAKSPLVNQYDISSVKMVLSGAAPLTQDTERDFLTRFNVDCIYQAFGMTELTAIGFVVPHQTPRMGASGKIVLNSMAKVIDVTSGRHLSYDQVGEICIKGPQVMKGYFNNVKATRDTVDRDGWLHTGDVGYHDKDGYFFITGRIKELIKHKGFQVAPAEVEGVIMTHPAVADAAVIGIPDASAGELPRAFVVKKQNVSVTELDISNFIKDRLTRHKWLTGGVQFVTSIPKTPSGKIIRREVVKLMTVSKL